MKNILFFFSTTQIGGAETNIILISRELAENGYNIFFAYVKDNGPFFQRIDFVQKGKLEIGPLKNVCRASLRYHNFIRENKIDVVFNFGLRVEIFSRIFSKLFGVSKVISNIRGADLYKPKLQVFLDRITKDLTDYWVSNSKAALDVYHVREKIPIEKSIVIYNFLDDSVNLPKNKHLHKNFSNSIGILANITENKGYFDLIKLSELLSQIGMKHKFIFAGEDKTNGQFFNALNNSKVKGNFMYLGRIDNKYDFFSSIDIFILPSYTEGMPTSIMEAMSYGVPVISTNVGGIPEQITDGYNGILCTPGDINALKEGIFALQDCSVREKYVSRSFDILKNKFRKEKSINMFINIIEGE